MEKNERENNNNVILLIVIAIATMVIVVIGATFAYLASSTADNGTANINAGFEGSEGDLLIIDAGTTLNVEARFDNFGKGEGDQTSFGLAKVVLQAAAGGTATHKYDIYLSTEENNMIYTAGLCYKKTEIAAGFEDQTDCVASSARVWGRDNSGEGACYNKPTENAVEGSLYESEQGCITNPEHMWVVEDGIAELAFDLYETTPATTKEECVSSDETDTSTTLGTCIDKKRNVYGGTSTTLDDCNTQKYTWVPNYYDEAEGVCYKVSRSLDITVAEAGDENNKLVLEDVEITASDGEATTHRYRVAVSLINLPHNQIANGGHTYAGKLNIQVQKPAVNAPVEP